MKSGVQHERPDTALRRVVVVADEMVPAALNVILDPYRDSDLFVIAPVAYDEWRLDSLRHRHLPFNDDPNLQWYLKLWGPVDVIVNTRTQWPADHESMLCDLLFHLRPGGEYIIPRTAFKGYKQGNPLELRLAGFAGVLTRGEDAEATVRDRELARAVAEVRIGREQIRVVKRGQHYLKLSDRWANRMLGTRNPDLELTELGKMAATTFASDTVVTSHGASTKLLGLESTVKTPELHLRHYRGRIGFVSNALTFTDAEILPDSFRHHLAGNLTNPRFIDIDRNFARIEQHVLPRTELTGSYFMLDSQNSGHFGHLMTEVISRLWGWDRAKADDSDLKAIFRLRFPNERQPALERLVLSAFGIAEEDITWIDHPVYLESMYAATPMFHNARPHYVHPEIRDIWRRIRAGLPSSDGPTWEKIFVSRRDSLGNRRCLNRAAVEERFVSAGFEVIYPEDHSLNRQVQIFSHARVIAGFGGSAMFNSMFAERLERMIVLTHEAYTARNEVLIALPLGVRVDYFWNRPNVDHPPHGWSTKAYKSDWTFDLARHQKELDSVFASLGS